MKDCIVVGGGPAGLTAALYLARFLRSVLVFDAGDGRARTIPKTHNLTPFPEGISGQELLGRMRKAAESYGAEIDTGTVGGVTKHGDGFRVATNSRVETARNLIFASGVVNHRPPLSVEDHERGVAEGLIRYCPVCDAHEVRGRRIAVLGSGQHGFQEAAFIRHFSSSVTLIPPAGSTAEARDGIDVLDSPVKSLALSESQVVAALENGETRQFDTLYVALGTSARTGLAASLGVRLVDGGCVDVDEKLRTNVDRVYAIGDVAKGLDQISVAMGHGAIAATAIHNDIREKAVDRTLSG